MSALQHGGCAALSACQPGLASAKADLLKADLLKADLLKCWPVRLPEGSILPGTAVYSRERIGGEELGTEAS